VISKYPDYLRISLLSACNLRCNYCQPVTNRKGIIVAPYDKVRSAIRFLHRSGIRKIRFTGGEPTLSKSLPGLVSFVKEMDSRVHVAVTTNGVLLTSLASTLSAAGLDSVNISLDTLDPIKFRALTGTDKLNQVISGIDTAKQYIGSIKLNCVLIRGFNDSEVEKLTLFAHSRRLDIRFIEFMPNRYGAPGDSRFITSEEVRNRLPWQFRAVPVEPDSAARYFTDPSLGIKVGFISSVSHPFCTGCNRIRLAADGLLYTCLYNSSNINLFDLLSGDIQETQAEFARLIRSKLFLGCRSSLDCLLPSFSAIGG